MVVASSSVSEGGRMHRTLCTDQSIPPGSCFLGLHQRVEVHLVYQVQCIIATWLVIYMDLLFHCKVKILIVSMIMSFYVSISLTFVEHFKLWCWKVLQKIVETQYPEHHLCHLQKGTLQVHILIVFLLHQWEAWAHIPLKQKMVSI